MPERTSYHQGTPNWVDLQTPDQEAARAFYSALFGWTYDDQPMAPGQVYSMARMGKGVVAAIAPQSPDLAESNAPARWNTYLAVDSADAAAAKVAAAGGQVAVQPFDVPGAGRMAFVLDPGGAAVAFWQAGQHIGATLVNEPGALVWNELITTDPSAAAFYEQVLGLTSETIDSAMGKYTMFQADGRQVAGTTAPQALDEPNRWQVYFAVANADACLVTAAGQNAYILSGPTDTPAGRMAAVRDPQGAVFSIIQPAGSPG